MEAIQLEIGVDLIAFVEEEGENLIEAIRRMRRQMERAGRLRVPPIRICDNSSLPPRGYRIFIYERAVAGGELGLADGAAELSLHLARNIRRYAI